MRAARVVAVALCALAWACSAGDDSPVAATARSAQALDLLSDGFLTPSTTGPGDLAGSAIAVSGDLALVAVPYDDSTSAAEIGRVAVYVRSAAMTWNETQLLEPDVSAPNAWFGSDLALQGTTALVGAAGLDTAYAYAYGASSFGLQTKLSSPAGVSSSLFGNAVALDQDTALVADVGEDQNRGVVYEFSRVSGSWTLKDWLLPTDTQPGLGFGSRLLVSGNRAFVAAAHPVLGGPGSVYAFERSGPSWVQTAKLTAPVPAVGDRFGEALALVGTSLMVGAPALDRVFEFVPSGNSWQLLSQLAIPSGVGEFGRSLAADGTWLAIGAPLAQGIGRVYFHSKTGSSWSPALEIPPWDPLEATSFGHTLAIDTPRLVIGAPNHGWFSPGSAQGAAYVFLLGLGQPCTDGSTCPTGHCVEDVCCDSACTDPCATCRVKFGAPEDGSCAPTKSLLAPPVCGGLICDGVSTKCPTKCDEHADCAGALYCDLATSKCVAKKLIGAACTEDDECDSYKCRDGVCCNTECTGCNACAYAKTAFPDGECTPAIAGTDPHDACAVDPGFPGSCLADGMCDGLGKCRVFATETTPCGATYCSGEIVNGMLCDAKGVCAQSTVSCGAYPCLGKSCTTSCTQDSDCSSKGFCSPAGTCEPRREVGAPCTAPTQCVYSLCVDGVCCNDACAGQCEHCFDPGKPGICTPVFGEPPPGRPACSGGDPNDVCSASFCDGVNGQICAGRPTGIVCQDASCTDGKMTQEAQCQGSGSCPQKPPIDCGAYACGPSACLTSCASSADCALGYSCDGSGKCSAVPVCDGDHTVLSPSGQTTDCRPFRCSAGGTCFSACSSSEQCVADHQCTSSGTCEPRGEASETPGCGCRSAGSEGNHGGWLLASLALLALRRRAIYPRTGACCRSSRTTTRWRA